MASFRIGTKKLKKLNHFISGMRNNLQFSEFNSQSIKIVWFRHDAVEQEKYLAEKNVRN